MFHRASHAARMHSRNQDPNPADPSPSGESFRGGRRLPQALGFRRLCQVARAAMLLGAALVALVATRPLRAESAGAGPRDPVNSVKTPSTTPGHRILFIGNSLTYWNDGLYTHLQKLAASAEAPVALETDKSVKGGATLKVQWERPEPRALIARGPWTEVLLQEDLPEINVSYFREHARNFVGEIRKAKARPILLMTWAYARLNWIDNEQIALVHRTLARELGVEVAPVAVAWQRVLRERPGLDLFATDREHPSLAGTYLQTCVVYATVMRASPVSLGYVPAGIPPEDALFLRRVAWETVRDWTP